MILLVPISIGTAILLNVGYFIWRYRRYGASGFFTGGDPIYEGLAIPIKRTPRWNVAVLRSTNEEQPIAIRSRMTGFASFNIFYLLFTQQEAVDLAELIDAALAAVLHTSEKTETGSFSRRVGLTNQRISVIANGRLGPINIRRRALAPLRLRVQWLPMSVAQGTELRSQLQTAISRGIQDAPHSPKTNGAPVDEHRREQFRSPESG